MVIFTHKILVLSHLFPNNIENSKGIFVYDQVRKLSKFNDIKVISPIIWIPSRYLFGDLGKLTKVNNKMSVNSIDVHYPRYFAIPLRIPSKILMWLAGLLYTVYVLFEVIKIKGKFNFDIIHSHFAFPDGFSSVILGRIFKKPVVVTVHGSDINLYTEKKNHLKPMVIYALKNASHIVVVSTALKDKIIKLGINTSKISVIPNGYDPELFKPIDKYEARRSLELPTEKKILLFVGNIYPVKGVSYLIEAMKIISERSNDIMLILVGEGYLKPQLQSTVKEYGLSNKVIFAGSQPHERIPLWMNACDLLVLPSLSEGFGAVLIEAAACGKPIVASDIGGIPEASNKFGRRLVPPKNPHALANSILEALDSNFDSGNIIRENKKFDFNNIVWQLTNIYTQVKHDNLAY